LVEIMDAARRIEDVLQVYNQLVDVRGQIEVIKGQMQYYERAAALSAIEVDIIADTADQPLQIGKWQPRGVAKDALETLINYLQGFVDFLIWMAILVLPMAATVLAPLYLIGRSFLKWRRGRKAKKDAARQTPPEL